MNITILSRNKNLYSTNRLYNAGTKRGHHIIIVDYLRCYINIGQNQSAIYYDGKKLDNFEKASTLLYSAIALINRSDSINSGTTFFGRFADSLFII